MAASYPAGFDTMSDPSTNLSGPPLHSTMHNQINDVIEAIEAELGINPSGADATVAALLSALPTRYMSTTRHGGKWRRVASLSVPNTTVFTVTMDTEDSDTDAYGTATSTTFTIPTGLDGIYAVTAMALWAGTPTGNNFIRLQIGGNNFDMSGNTIGQVIGGSIVVPLLATNTIVMQVYQSSAGAMNMTGTLWVTRVAA